MDVQGLDFETYGTRDLKKVGLANYLADPEFRPLVATVSFRHTDGTEDELELDFVQDHDGACQALLLQLGDFPIGVHNAGFERGVLRRMGFNLPHDQFIDSALLARVHGADSRLANAARQMLSKGMKLEEGKALIQKFSKPNKVELCEAEQLHQLGQLFDDPDWLAFKGYCTVDAILSRRLVETLPELDYAERGFEIITQRMNDVGWTVDIDTVMHMQKRYEENKELLLKEFRDKYDPAGTLNLNSLKQLKEWCAQRGVKATSFDEAHVKSLLDRVSTKLAQMGLYPVSQPRPNWDGLSEIAALLRVKQELGGSSLKKLQVILDTVSPDGKLRNQYMHYGASASGRTTGRGVQMQNLPRMNGVGRDMSSLKITTPTLYWPNEDLSANIRQVFTASTPGGALLVGDFASVESRGLAYMAGETWKLQAYQHDKDLYKVLAGKMFDVDYYAVTKDQRQIGKVGELSCGYGSGNVAVKKFAKKMGLEMTDEESSTLVNDWRDANPKVLAFWENLNNALHLVVAGAMESNFGTDHTTIMFKRTATPQSLLDQHPGAVSVLMLVHCGGIKFQRVFHGCYVRGRNICYYRASGKASGDLWSPYFTDPQTKGRKYHSLYGGKLAAVATQSLCREIFFRIAANVQSWCDVNPGLRLIGQFHDELIVDFDPSTCSYTQEEIVFQLQQLMSTFVTLPGFPLAAKVNAGYRYTK